MSKVKSFQQTSNNKPITKDTLKSPTWRHFGKFFGSRRSGNLLKMAWDAIWIKFCVNSQPITLRQAAISTNISLLVVLRVLFRKENHFWCTVICVCAKFLIAIVFGFASGLKPPTKRYVNKYSSLTYIGHGDCKCLLVWNFRWSISRISNLIDLPKKHVSTCFSVFKTFLISYWRSNFYSGWVKAS